MHWQNPDLKTCECQFSLWGLSTLLYLEKSSAISRLCWSREGRLNTPSASAQTATMPKPIPGAVYIGVSANRIAMITALDI